MSDIGNKSKTKKREFNFKPGVSGNPNGRPKLPDHLLQLKKDASVQAQLDIITAFQMTQKEMFLVEQDANARAGFKALVSCLNNAIQIGSSKEVSMFLDRIIGKVKDTVEVSGVDGGAIETNNNGTTMNEILTLLKAKNEDNR